MAVLGARKDNEFFTYFLDKNSNVAQRTGGSIINPSLGPGVAALVAPNGTLNTGELIRLVGGNFIDGRGLLTHIWTELFNNGGSTTFTDGEMILETNTTANGRARVESTDESRFITATFNLSHQAMSTPDETNTDVIRRWGCYDPTSSTENGIFFENDSGAFSVIRIKGGVEEQRVLSTSFDNESNLIFDGEIHIYEIFYNAGTIFFLQDGLLLHKLSSLDSAAFETPHLKVGHDIENINGNTTANTLMSRGSSISRIGSSSAIPRPFVITTTGTFLIKNTPGRLHSIVITQKGVGSAVINVFNNVVAVAPFLVSPINSANVQGSLPFNVEFSDGLTVEVTGASVSLTVVFD